MIEKIISGGQRGTDEWSLEIAKQYGIQTGGFAPKCFMTENGPNLALRDVYGLTEITSSNPAHRTTMNVKASNAILYFCKDNSFSPGKARTQKDAKIWGKEFVYVRPDTKVSDIVDFIEENLRAEKVLMIGGTRRSKWPDGEKFVKTTLSAVLEELGFRKNENIQN